MLAATGGEVHGQVTTPEKRSIGTIGKVGIDQKLRSELRVRLTGSFYANNKAASSTLFTGDRGGSTYYDCSRTPQSTETANAWSGQIRPGFSNKVNAEVINPFIKIGGAESSATSRSRKVARRPNRGCAISASRCTKACIASWTTRSMSERATTS
jgi:hypothetical protein